MNLELFDSAAAIVGRTGSGKTYAAKGVVEQMLDERRRVCIVDPTGAWWGLRQMRRAPSEGAAFDIPIFGGDHADVPLGDAAGDRLGEIIAKGEVAQAIVDVSEMSTAAQVRFLTAFFEALYTGNRGAIHLILDEADLMAPQNPLPETRRLQGVVNKIVRRGRIKGFRPLMITQRPQVIDKSVLSQIDCLIAMKLTAPQDRKAILDWVRSNAGGDLQTNSVDSLPGLKVGTGIVWRPSDGSLETITFPPIRTFDSSKAPEVGDEPVQPMRLKLADFDKLRAALSPPADASETPKAAAQVKQVPDAAAIEEAERRGYVRGRESLLPTLGHATAAFEQLRADLGQIEANVSKVIDDMTAATETSAPDLMAQSMKRDAAPKAVVVHHAGREPKPPSIDLFVDKAGRPVTTSPLSRPQERILDAIAWLESIGLAAPDKGQVALLADASPKSSAYANNLGALRTAGLVDYPAGGCVALTDEGRKLAAKPAETPTHALMLEKIKAKLSAPQASILGQLCVVWPHSARKEALARAVGASPSSSAFANNLGRLRSLGLIDYPASGQARAEDRMFPGGRR